MLDEESPLGRLYEERRKESKFYRDARFYSVNQSAGLAEKVKIRQFTNRANHFQKIQIRFKVWNLLKKVSGRGCL